MTLSMDNFTPDPSYCVDIDPITWETSICKYTELGKQCVESFIDPDIKVEFLGFTSHEFRVQPVYDHTRMVVHYRSYILEHQIADQKPVYLLLEVINNLPRLSWDEDYKVLWNRAGRRKEMDKWTFRRSRGVVDGYTCFTGYSSKYPDGLIMTANGWICNLFNHYTKTL